MMNIMKRNYKLLLLVLLLAFASCSFTTKKFSDPDKDKLLVQLITYVLDQGHFSPKDLNDSFSEPRIKSEVRFRIDSLFREKSISIPFPQRDIHIINK